MSGVAESVLAPPQADGSAAPDRVDADKVALPRADEGVKNGEAEGGTVLEGREESLAEVGAGALHDRDAAGVVESVPALPEVGDGVQKDEDLVVESPGARDPECASLDSQNAVTPHPGSQGRLELSAVNSDEARPDVIGASPEVVVDAVVDLRVVRSVESGSDACGEEEDAHGGRAETVSCLDGEVLDSSRTAEVGVDEYSAPSSDICPGEAGTRSAQLDGRPGEVLEPVEGGTAEAEDVVENDGGAGSEQPGSTSSSSHPADFEGNVKAKQYDEVLSTEQPDRQKKEVIHMVPPRQDHDAPTTPLQPDIASSEEEFRPRSNLDKEADSSMDSTANSALKPSVAGARALLEEAHSSSSEDSASSRPRLRQPVQHQQPKKRIDLGHQFVREIVKIQHDREQFEKHVQAEKQNAANSSAQDSTVVRDSGKKQEKRVPKKSTTIDSPALQQEPSADKNSEVGPVGRDVDRKEFSNASKPRASAESLRGKAADLNLPLSVKYGRQDTGVQDGSHNVGRRPEVVSFAPRSKDLWKENDLQDRSHYREREAEAFHFGQSSKDGWKEEAAPGRINRGKTRTTKPHQFMAIYRPPNARDTSIWQDEGEAVADSNYVEYDASEQIVSFVDKSLDPRDGVDGSAHPSVTGLKDKGPAVYPNVPATNRRVHCVDPQALEEETVGLGIKVTLDTTRHQRFIEYLDPAAETEASKFIVTIPGDGPSKNVEVRTRGMPSKNRQDLVPSGSGASDYASAAVPASFQFSARPEEQPFNVGTGKGTGLLSSDNRGRARRSSGKTKSRREHIAVQATSGKGLESQVLKVGQPPEMSASAGPSQVARKEGLLKDSDVIPQEMSRLTSHDGPTFRGASNPVIDHGTSELPSPYPRISERWGDVVEDVQEGTRRFIEPKLHNHTPVVHKKWGDELDSRGVGEAASARTSKRRGRSQVVPRGTSSNHTRPRGAGVTVDGNDRSSLKDNLHDVEQRRTGVVSHSKKLQAKPFAADVQPSVSLDKSSKKTVWERLGPQKCTDSRRAKAVNPLQLGGRGGGAVQFSSQDWRKYRDLTKDTVAALPYDEVKEGLSSGHGSNAESDFSHISEESGEGLLQFCKDSKQKRSKLELYVPRRGFSGP